MENDQSSVFVLQLLLLLQTTLFFHAISINDVSSSILSRVTNFVLRRSTTPCTFEKSGESIPTLEFDWPNGQGTQKFFDGRGSSIRWRHQKGVVYQIWAGFKPEIVLTRPEHLRSFFNDSDKHRKAPNENSGWLIGEILGSCLGLVSGSRWASMRIPWEHPFSLPAAKSYVSLMTSSAREFIQDLESKAGNTPDTFQIQVTESLKTYPFFVVASILFGELSETQKATLLNLAPLRERLWQEGIKGGLNRTVLAKVFRTRGSRMPAEFKRRWRAFIKNAYEESITHKKNGAIEKLLTHAKHGEYLTIEECMQTVDETLYANLDVTTSAVAWSHVLIAQNQAIQDEVRTEVRLHRQLSETEWEDYINRSDTILAFSVLEASLLRPILAFSNPESAPADKLVGDIVVPRNTDVIVDSHAINVAHPFWINGTEFNPHRFEGLQPRQYRYHLFRFGFGPRKCLGQHVADRMIRALLAEVLSKYCLSVSESSESQDHQIQDESWVSLPDVLINCVRQ
ncbi:cytochrome p450 oxidoreductase [Colletotrichum chrysophilum]|uniref:Cytochrome p450 oxidoreductase n=1 Tax=Colletotrichum chrysophilum TaxID=1836956 RepID=A0AAD9A901_9PEZI|nr:cytochrome p450 oxidoreductase [Colletotrichum chrysophilum]